MLLLKSERPRFFLTMPYPGDNLLWQMPHRGEGEVKKCPTNAEGRGDGHNWN